MRLGSALAYDPAHGKVVLFGGGSYTSLLNDTWEWDGTTWTQRTPATVPAARSGQARAYEAARGKGVLFGGRAGSPAYYLNDAWEWDGTSWTQRTPDTAPPVRFGHALAYDSARGRMVMFGGWNTEKGN